jgi:hypothetical protein
MVASGDNWSHIRASGLNTGYSENRSDTRPMRDSGSKGLSRLEWTVPIYLCPDAQASFWLSPRRPVLALLRSASKPAII